MIRMFVGREGELEFLGERFKGSGPECIVVYGRRRVGKTELIKQFIGSKDAIYFLSDKRGTEKNTERLAEAVGEHFGELPVRASGFEDVFRHIKSRVGKKRFIVTIDEFSYLVEKDDSVPSVFQLIVDEILKNTNIFLILCGSSVSMMESGALSYKSPLYGRRTGQIFLKPLEFKYLMDFFSNKGIEEIVEIYSVLHSIPAYLAQFDQQKSLIKNIEDTFLVTTHMFYNEPEMLIKEELREPATYLSILQSMTGGPSKMTDIAIKAKMNVKDVPIYINTLMKLGFVKKEIPVTEDRPKTKKSLYSLGDNFFRFWFTFIAENKSKIEGLEKEDVSNKIKENLSSYTGKAFEDVCAYFLLEMRKKKIIEFSKLGRWWGHTRVLSPESGVLERKEIEIDLIGLDNQTKKILFCECKWQDDVNAEKVLKELKEKAKFVDWNIGKRKEYFCVIAKSFSKKIKEENVFLYDLKDIAGGWVE